MGYYLVTSLTKVAQENDCYKVILDCSPENVGFYEKCGYKDGGVEMVCRF